MEERQLTIDSSDRFVTEMYLNQEEIELMEKYLYLAPSKIHGIGVFARIDIPEDTEIGYYIGPPWNGVGDDRYVYWWGDAEIPMLVVGPMRFMNHSSEPNTDLYEEGDPPYYVPACLFYASRDIRKDEEITSCYGEGFQEWIDAGMPEDKEELEDEEE